MIHVLLGCPGQNCPGYLEYTCTPAYTDGACMNVSIYTSKALVNE